MATITIDASSQANIQGVNTVQSDAVSNLQAALVTFTPSGTYDQDASEPIELTNVDEAIEQSRRNGKTVTLVDAVGYQDAPLADTPGTRHVPTTVAVATNDVTCDIYVLGGSEYTDDTALPTYQRPMGVLVTFTEA
jgi:hypothetical protein